jgi:EF hand
MRFVSSVFAQSGRIIGLALLLPVLAACSSERAGDVTIIKHPAYDWDLNDNGAVTKEEYKAYREGIFTSADADRNGVVDEDEWDDIRDDNETGIRRAAFIALDFDGNGVLTFGEIMALPESDFFALDTNGDTVISSAELNDASKRRTRGGLRRRDADEGFRRDPDAGTY